MSLQGQQLGRYRLLSLLGKGGMGEVYLADDSGLRQVAIKVIKIESLFRPDDVRRASLLFRREIQAIVPLDHPHILPIYDHGESDVGKIHLAYMVMPYCEKDSLAAWLDLDDNRISLLPPDVAHVLLQAAAALQYAHDCGVVHRDVKPSNFLIRTGEGRLSDLHLVLADFGIAQLPMMTPGTSSDIPGSPPYMAPERWRGQTVPASDQYSLAIMAYELLTGQLPFRGNLQQLMTQHISQSPASLSVFDSSLPKQLDQVMQRALAKRPEQRFDSVTHFAQAFQYALSRANPQERTVAEALLSHHPPLPTLLSVKSRRTNVPLPAFLLLVLLVLAGGISFFAFGHPLFGLNVRPLPHVQAPSPPAIANPYAPYTGMLVLNDPLDANREHRWEEDTDHHATCQFLSGGYHVSQNRVGNFALCTASSVNYKDFTYQVQMNIMTGGAGGIIFRADSSRGIFYYFRIGLDGSYDVTWYTDNLHVHARMLLKGTTMAISTQRGQLNLLAVVAKGEALTFYVNDQILGMVQDRTASQGQIGVVADASNGPVEAIFTDAMVWQQ